VYGGACAVVEPLDCWGNADCETYAQATLDQAAAMGCTSQAVTAFDCIADHPPTCVDDSVTHDDACTPALDAYAACLKGSGSCDQNNFLGPCAVICGVSVWGAECSIDAGNSYADCFCRVGPKLGTKFTLPVAQKCDEAESAKICAP
jgi:hypothetical protein